MSQSAEKDAPARDHYLFVNMRDIGCNCGERYRPEGIAARTREDREAWFADHLTRVTSPEVGKP